MNISKILVGSPKGTKLWSPVMGVAEFDTILCDETHTFYIQVKDVYGYCYKFTIDGKLSENGQCLLFPSKEMKDWEKFVWKKGDVLQYGKSTIVFENWIGEQYLSFRGAHEVYGDSKYASGSAFRTMDYIKITDENEIRNYLGNITKLTGGKLNLETLEIEDVAPVHDASPSCFKPFQQVLVRNSKEEIWLPRHYAHKCGMYHICTDGHEYYCCIPYEGNEHLLYGNEMMAKQ